MHSAQLDYLDSLGFNVNPVRIKCGNVKEAIEAIENGFTTDAFGICVDDAIAALFELTGKRVTNAVADEIFKKFCVGK